MFNQFSITVFARELSKASIIFNKIKNGVVTVISAGHGSGFLVYKSGNKGLIITNSHVIAEAGDTPQIRFGPKKVIEGKVIANDRNSDVAIILVNLKKLSNYKVLRLYNPPVNESLVYMGEKVIAIGSPIEWETMEKTLTDGIVSKVGKNTIIHTASINQGNSGGPLLNYDGYVIGINSFGPNVSDNNGLGGAISINKAKYLLSQAKHKINNYHLPSPNLFPDVSGESYPIENLIKGGDQFILEKRKSDDYIIKTTYYDVEFVTPPIVYAFVMKNREELLKKRKQRAAKKGFELDEDEFLPGTLGKFYNYTKPVVQVVVKPKPQLTTGSTIQNLTLLTLDIITAATTGYAGSSSGLMRNEKEFKKDFLKMKMVELGNGQVLVPYLASRIPIEKMEQYHNSSGYNKLVDKTYGGIYEYNPEYFLNNEKLQLVIKTEGEEESKVIDVPEKIKELIIKDFQPYWNAKKYVKISKYKRDLVKRIAQKEISIAQQKFGRNDALEKKKLKYFKKKGKNPIFYTIPINKKYSSYMVRDNGYEYWYDGYKRMSLFSMQNNSSKYPKVFHQYDYKSGRFASLNIYLDENERYIVNRNSEITGWCNAKECKYLDFIPAVSTLKGPFYTYKDVKKAGKNKPEKQPKFDSYIKKVNRKVKKSWEPPKEEGFKKIVATFKVDQEGNLGEIILKKSASKAANNAAIKAIKDSEPFKRLPKYFTEKDANINIIFNYEAYMEKFDKNKDEPDFGLYIKNIQKQIKTNWNPPKEDRSKRIVCKFKIDKEGNLISVSLKKPSNSKSANNAAIKAIEKAAPFKPLPKEFKGKDVDIEFTFDYNALEGKSY